MAGPTLPPQAYTREILTAAFNWLQSQPESVRKIATTPDALVGLYTRAKRFGNSSLESDAPVSSQNFMSDLKNLAEGLKQFEEPKADSREPSSISATNPQTFSAAPSFSPPLSNVRSSATTLHGTSSVGASVGVSGGNAAGPVYQASNAATGSATGLSSGLASGLAFGGLNERSRAMIQEVKEQLNLSSESEAANMLVSLAYISLKNLLS